MFAAINIKKAGHSADAKIVSIGFCIATEKEEKKHCDIIEKKRFNMDIVWPKNEYFADFGDFDEDCWKDSWSHISDRTKEMLQTDIKTANDVRDYIDSLKEQDAIFLSMNLVSDVIALDRLIGNSTLYRSRKGKRVEWICVDSMARKAGPGAIGKWKLVRDIQSCDPIAIAELIPNMYVLW